MAKKFVFPVAVAVVAGLILVAFHSMNSWVQDRLLAGDADLYEDVALVLDSSVISIALTMIICILAYRAKIKRDTKSLEKANGELKEEIQKKDERIVEQDQTIQEFRSIKDRIQVEEFLEYQGGWRVALGY